MNNIPNQINEKFHILNSPGGAVGRHLNSPQVEGSLAGKRVARVDHLAGWESRQGVQDVPAPARGYAGCAVAGSARQESRLVLVGRES